MDSWRGRCIVVTCSWNDDGRAPSLADVVGSPQYSIAGVFEHERDAYLLAGFLASYPQVRTVLVWRIKSREWASLPWEYVWRGGDSYWESAAGEWEAREGHYALMELWHRDAEAESKIGVQPWIAEKGWACAVMFGEMGLRVAIPVSSASCAGAGAASAGPSEPPA